MATTRFNIQLDHTIAKLKRAIDDEKRATARLRRWQTIVAKRMATRVRLEEQIIGAFDDAEKAARRLENAK